MAKSSVSRAQRIGIWIIAVVMTLGTIGSFVVIILQNDNQNADQARINQLTQEYSAAYSDYTAKLEQQTADLSKKYYPTFSKYEGRAAEFEADSVKELKTTDLKTGSGEALKEGQSFSAYYIGWTPDGKIFDGSIEDGALKAPIAVSEGGVIQGWSKGVVGMKMGGIRELSIPADLAYGESGYGDIPANTPLKFVIMVVPTPATIEEPAMPQELVDYYYG